MKIVLVFIVLAGLVFAAGFEAGYNHAGELVKEPIPEWYQDKIKSWIPIEIIDSTKVKKPKPVKVIPHKKRAEGLTPKPLKGYKLYE
jgi:hypothetical protein